MHRRTILLVCTLGLLVVLAAACASAEPTPTPTPTPTRAPAATPTPTPPPAPTATHTPTATPRPGETPTPRPTATPTPTAVPPTPTPTPGVQIKRGGVLSQWLREPPHFDSHQSTIDDLNITQSVYEHLIRLDKPTAEVPGPWLATRWEFSADGKTLTLFLRNDVKFSDGQPLTCADAQFSFNRIMDPPTGMVSPRKAAFAQVIDKVTCPDPLTVVFNLKRPWADALVSIADPYALIYPKHVAEPLDKKGEFMKRFEAQMGSGAFKVKRYVANEFAEVERNPNFHVAGQPYLDGVKYWVIPDTTAQLTAFQTGKLDHLWALESAELSKQAAGQSRGRYTVKEFPLVIVVNIIPVVKGGSVWADQEARQALSYAACRDPFIATMGDIAFIRWFGGILPPDSRYALPESEIRTFAGYGKDCAANQAKAREILQRKGLAGKKIQAYTWGDLSAFRDSAVVVCDSLNKVGMDCTTLNLETGVYFDTVNNRRVPTDQIVVHSVGITSNTVDGILGQVFHPDGVRNYGVYEDQKIRDLYTQQSQSLDPAQRKTILAEYQRYFLTQQYHIVLGWRGNARLWWNYVRGSITNTPNLYYWPMLYEDVWMEK